MMSADLKILIIEDNQDDADLLRRELKKSGLNFTAQIVQARQEYEQALKSFVPDIILSDYSLPAFDAVTAFHISQSMFPHIPFIIVSGTIGDENAVALIKSGITDYTPKDKLFTLSQKINRALKDTEARKERKLNAEKLKVQAAALMIANEALQEKTQLLEQQEKKLIKINEDLLRLNQHLEKRVLERTEELEQLNHALKDLNLSKDKFVAVISHDLRNPLSVLLLAAEALTSESEGNLYDPIKPFIKIIHRSSHNMSKQLNELVNWAKTQQDKVTLNLDKLNLFSAVEQSFELLKPSTIQKNITLVNNVLIDIYVDADALMLRSILQNLVTNSIKYSLLGGEVQVTAKQVDAVIEICIIDTGIGMDTNTSENLFNSSHSASIAGTNNEMGSGLGLILVKDFVGQLGGTLKVESELKKGTCISFTVPASL